MRRFFLGMAIFAGLIVSDAAAAADGPATYSVGVGQADITPEYPVRLSGFGFRRTESEGVTQQIWAKALAISSTPESDPVVLITVDNLGVPASMCDDIAKRLQAKVGLKRSRISITATHTHTAPMLTGVAPTLFSGPISDEHRQRTDRYSVELADKLELVAIDALKDRQPARLSWGIGSVNFAINRRTKGGPVDHDLPLLVVKRMDGRIRAIYVSYACHCVTLSNNKISGDWAGYAQDLIQRDFPSSVALVSIGCGADQNPSSGVTGDKTDVALQQGAEIAAEVKRMVSNFLAPVSGEIVSELTPITLDFADHPTRAEWEERAKKNDASGYHARVQLERLDRGVALQRTLDYPICSWKFGDSLAMVFLPGEVVVDYSRRIKRELDGGRLWITAYANDAPCYIPSERVLKEGGYEALSAMYYYDRPGAFKAGLEDQIITEVHRQLGPQFRSPFDANKTSGTMPQSPLQSLASLQTTQNLRVDLVVAEPLIVDPVAIDFGWDGGLWVAEMHDYPDGIPASETGTPDEKTPDHPLPGGRIRLVRDSDGDGQFDRSTIFLDHIPLPTGVTVWRNGVLICTAPDILYAEDTDGDDKADVVKTLFTGFGTGNNQARLNSLVYGVDGWVYGSCGLFGGRITNFKGEKYELGDRDFRIQPESGVIEAATGRTQQGRVRDDFGNWFGCDNSNLAYHYPLAEHYLKRNPYIASPVSRVNIVQTDAAQKLFPARGDAQRFQLSGPPGTVTAACGIGVYRDSLLGPEYQQNIFVCEPVNLLVHHMSLKNQGASFVAERPANEAGTEFLRSKDGWFRPVQAVTGPDGALWVVDMYRFIIEDPRWIPKDDLDLLDSRAGSTLGRIYRVTNASHRTPPAVPFRLTTRGPAPVNPRTQNSTVFQELDLQRLQTAEGLPVADVPEEVLSDWRDTLTNGNSSQKMFALRKLLVQGKLTPSDIQTALTDSDPGIRIFGMTLAERSPDRESHFKWLKFHAEDPELHVRLQAACSLGEWNDPGVGEILARMALRDAGNPYVVAAVFSSLNKSSLASFTTKLFEELAGNEPPSSLMAPFLATAVGYCDDAAIQRALVAVAKTDGGHPQAWQLYAVTDLVVSLATRSHGAVKDQTVEKTIQQMRQQANSIAVNQTLDEKLRVAAIGLMGRDPSHKQDDLSRLTQLLSLENPPSVQQAAVLACERIASEEVPAILASRYREMSPSVQPQVVDTILSRDAWYPLFFNELARGTIPVASITAAQRQELVGHPTASIRDRASEIFAISINADRQQVIQQYRAALDIKGDAELGRAVFTKNCSQCHKLGEIGHSVGPNLAMVANKTPSFLLQELFDPNRNVDTRYTSYVAATKDGLIRTGILSSESANSITLLATEGKQYPILRTDLEELRGTGKSLMPEGMEKELSIEGVANLIAFLNRLPTLPKQIAGNAPSVVKADQGRFALMASQASIYGDQITFESPFGNIGYWHGLQDHAAWTVELSEEAEFDVYLDGACDAASAGNNFRLNIGDRSISGQVQSTGGWNKYVTSKLGTIGLKAGRNRIEFRPEGAAIRGALVDLRGLYFVPAGEKLAMNLQNPGKAAFDADQVAKQILDDTLKEDQRELLIGQNPEHAAELVTAMTRELDGDLKEEYRRIPWIWRVAVACGQRDQPEQLVKLLDVSLPQKGKPLREWQAVVIGGGVINGIGLKGAWPRARIAEILQTQPELSDRWKNALTLASAMADDKIVNTWTRYDALRMIALDDWNLRRPQLIPYLKKGVDDELQQGAVSGLSDVESNDVAKLLLDHIGHFNDENRNLALDALLRSKARTEVLLDAIENAQILPSRLNDTQRKKLRESADPAIRVRALRILDQ